MGLTTAANDAMWAAAQTGELAKAPILRSSGLTGHKNTVIVVRGVTTALGTDTTDAVATAIMTATQAALTAVRVPFDHSP